MADVAPQQSQTRRLAAEAAVTMFLLAGAVAAAVCVAWLAPATRKGLGAEADQSSGRKT
ncbi:MAG: hypothetical protein O2905_04870 [Proteobacteria bacterium]|nr:hypothetical protein [Pseudomonadota bacterium]MDA1132539.1 hypothetical protein [Pseudomonadota bacterium]